MKLIYEATLTWRKKEGSFKRKFKKLRKVLWTLLNFIWIYYEPSQDTRRVKGMKGYFL